MVVKILAIRQGLKTVKNTSVVQKLFLHVFCPFWNIFHSYTWSSKIGFTLISSLLISLQLNHKGTSSATTLYIYYLLLILAWKFYNHKKSQCQNLHSMTLHSWQKRKNMYLLSVDYPIFSSFHCDKLNHKKRWDIINLPYMNHISRFLRK